MEQGKRINSDSSSGENDPQTEKSSEDNIGVGRSYECTYCKRGFTNAQALGGHMNIHRKDKAKAKKTNQEEPSNLKNQNYTNSRYFPQISTPHDHDHHQQPQQQQQQESYYRLMGTQINYQVYLPSPNPNFKIGNNERNNPVWRRTEHPIDENLSLRIGLTPPSVEDGDGNEKDDEVDLELRLGHHRGP